VYTKCFTKLPWARWIHSTFSYQILSSILIILSYKSLALPSCLFTPVLRPKYNTKLSSAFSCSMSCPSHFINFFFPAQNYLVNISMYDAHNYALSTPWWYFILRQSTKLGNNIASSEPWPRTYGYKWVISKWNKLQGPVIAAETHYWLHLPPLLMI
jgi:hypothetical protein